MIPGALVSLCTDCSWSGLPERSWCPVCGGTGMRTARVHVGRVEETTVVRKGADPSGAPVRLGAVRLSSGGLVLARLEAGASEGGRVQLLDDRGAVVARPR